MDRHSQKGSGRGWKITVSLLTVILLVPLLTLFLQTVWSHRAPAFVPVSPSQNLSELLDKVTRSEQDYRILFQQTGLSKTAVDALLDQGEEGKQAVLETWEKFHTPSKPTCVPLIGGRFTCQDLLLDENGERTTSVPLAPLQAGDLLISFSTHTMGWRHGHAGLVVDPARSSVLEAVQIGMNSYQAHVKHWQNYANFLVLRVKGVTAEKGRQVAEYAMDKLNDLPYSLLPGITCPKDAPLEELPGLHCAYLPWYAWKQAEVDLDANGGSIVTVADLARSPKLEVVQVYGMTPELLADRQSGL